MLGDVRATVVDQEIDLGFGRQRCLLAVLLAEANRIVPAGELIERAWGPHAPQRARNTLYSYLSRLRRALAEAEDVELVRHRGGYRLTLDEQSVDMHRFRHLIVQARAADHDDTADTLFGQAFALWQGEAFRGLDSPWINSVRDNLEQDRIAAELDHTDRQLRRGLHAELVADLFARAVRHPLDERLGGQLILALFRNGRQADALREYERIRRLLAEELGTDPSPALRQLHTQILNGEATVSTTGPAAPPKLRQLPPGVSRFVGRAANLAALNEKLESHDPNSPPLVVAMHGPGGVGKTALALYWAHRVRDRFPDGHVFLDMRGYGPGEPVDPAAALDVVLRAAGVPSEQVPRSVEERTAMWRTHVFGRSILMVIDNVRDAAQVRPLLPGAGNVLVLVTSRNKLRGLTVVDGAQPVGVGELCSEEAIALVGGMIGAERAAREPTALAALIELCGKLPLALVIVAQQANRYPDVPLATLVGNLQAGAGRLDLFADPVDPAADPRTVFSWSYRALPEDAARAFRFLSLHPTPEITVSAASVLLRMPESSARRLLDILAAVHLLEHDPTGRYRYHDLLQAYAQELAQAHDNPTEITAARERVLDSYLGDLWRARIAAFGWLPLDDVAPADVITQATTLPDIATAIAWYEQNRATLRATIEYAEEHRFDRHAWQLAFLLRFFHEVQHYPDDVTRVADVAVRCATRLGDETAVLYATYTMGTACAMKHQTVTALRWLLKALEQSRRIGDQVMTSTTAVAIGLGHLGSGRSEEALEWLHRAVAAATASGCTGPLANALLNLGAIQGRLKQSREALDSARRSHALYRVMNSPYHAAFALGNMAEAAMDGGELDLALSYAEESIAQFETIGIQDQVSLPESLIIKGRILSQVGRGADAWQAWQMALRILGGAGNPRAAAVEELLVGCSAPEPHTRRRTPRSPSKPKARLYAPTTHPGDLPLLRR